MSAAIGPPVAAVFFVIQPLEIFTRAIDKINEAVKSLTIRRLVRVAKSS